MYKAYKFRIYPTAEQQQYFAEAFGCCRWFWNYALNLTQETYKETGKGLSAYTIKALLPTLKKEYEWLKTPYSQSLQAVALNLGVAFKNFFEKRAGFPSFKSKHSKQSISYPQNVTVGVSSLTFPKIGEVYCKIHRVVEGSVKSVTVSKNPDGRYYASILVDNGLEAVPSCSEGKAIGLDVGLIDFLVTSDGVRISNPNHLKKHSKNLKRKQQKLARKEKGSKTRARAKKLAAKVYSKISRVRADFQHKLSRKIVNDNQVIAVEDLNVRGMVRNHKLAKAISDASWSSFKAMIKYKAEKAGKIYQEVGRFFPSSKICNTCGHKLTTLPLKVRVWSCPNCNSSNDRDQNAAKNIRDEALRLLALGTSATAIGGEVRLKGKAHKAKPDALPCENRSQLSTVR